MDTTIIHTSTPNAQSQVTNVIVNQTPISKNDIRILPTELRLKIFKQALAESMSNTINPALVLAFSARTENPLYKEAVELQYELPWTVSQCNMECFNSLPFSTLEQIKHIVFQLPLSPESCTPKIATANNLETLTFELPQDGGSMSSCANTAHVVGIFLSASKSLRRIYVIGLADILDETHRKEKRWMYLAHYLKGLKFREISRDEGEDRDEDEHGVVLECDVSGGGKEILVWKR